MPGVRRSASSFLAPWPAQGSVPLVGWQIKCASLLMAGRAGEGFGGLVLALLYWKIVLSLVVGIGAGLITLAQALRMARLRGNAKAALRRSAGDLCRARPDDQRFLS